MSEIFPLEVRGQAISYFFTSPSCSGPVGPLSSVRWSVTPPIGGPLFWGYVMASVIMLFGGLVAFKFGIDAEGKALEDIAPPLSSYDENGNALTSSAGLRSGDDDRAPATYTVVVGVSATSKSPTALAWAAAQARQNDGRVVAVRAWRMPNPQATPSTNPAARMPTPTDVEHIARAAFEADVAATLGPDHGAEIRLVRGGKFRVLVQAADGADLLVVDAPRQLFAGPMFAHRLIYAAALPGGRDAAGRVGGAAVLLTRVAGAVGRGVVTAAGTAGRPGYQTASLT